MACLGWSTTITGSCTPLAIWMPAGSVRMADRPGLGGLLDEFSAVMMRTGQGDVEVAGTYQPGVDADAADNRVAYRGAVPEQLGQTDLVSGARPGTAPVEQKTRC